MLHVLKNAHQRIRALHANTKGSMPLALFLILSTTVIAVITIAIVTWQVAQTRNEQLTREAQLAVDSTINLASEALGASGRALLGIPVEEPADWVESDIYGVATKWWAIPLNSQDIARTVTPTPFTHTASNGTMAVSVDVNNDIYLTSDGISWVKTGDSPVPSNAISDFTYGRGFFIMTARPNSDASLGSILYYSSNGKDWKAAALFGADTNSLEKYAQVACSSTACVMVTGIPETRTRYWYSADLNSWSLQGDTNSDALLSVARDIAYGANRWVAAGHNGTTNEYSFSTDGSSWSTNQNMHSAGAADPVTQIDYASGAGFVAVHAGSNNSVIYSGYVDEFGTTPASSSVIYSSDASSWNVSTLPVAQHWTQLASNGTSFFLIAESDSSSALGGTAIALNATDPTNWITRSLPKADNYSTVAGVASSWLITTPLSNYGYLASKNINRPTLPNEVYIKAISTTSVNSVDTTYNKVYRFAWSDLRNRWELQKTYTDLEFSLESRFTISPQDAKVELVDGSATVSFTDASAGSPISWLWDFGDGTTSTDVNPTKVYTSSGSYTVRLTVTEPGGYASTYSEIVRIQEAPAAPRDVTVTPSSDRVTVRWVSPLDNGQAPIYEYSIRYRPQGTSTWTTITTDTNRFQYDLTGLTERSTYEVQVAARNSIGLGAWSALGSVDPYQPPVAPTNLSATGLVNMTVSFTAPSDNGGLAISGYRVQTATDATFTTNVQTIDIRTTSALIRYFDEYTTYYLRVYALNNAGLSEPTEAISFTTIGRPEAPASPSTDAIDDEIVIAWSAPANDGGSAVTGYRVEYTTIQNDYDAGQRITTTNTEYAFPSTPGTTYYVRVSAISAAGTGAKTAEMSATGNSVVQTIPSLSITPQSEAAYIEWVSPTLAQSGGSAIQQYVLTWTSSNGVANSATFASSTTAILVDAEDTTGDGIADGPLTAGTSYDFTLTAVNGVGSANFNLSTTPTP